MKITDFQFSEPHKRNQIPSIISFVDNYSEAFMYDYDTNHLVHAFKINGNWFCAKCGKTQCPHTRLLRQKEAQDAKMA